jgi:hypothetical protein
VKKIDKRVAFPCISVNNMVWHISPLARDDTIFEDVSDEGSRRNKTNLGHISTLRWENGKLFLSQQTSMEKILMRFNMKIVKLINVPLGFHCNIYSSLCLGSKELKDSMSRVQYNKKVGDYNAMFKYFTCWCCSGNMEKPSKKHGNECLNILEAQVSPIVVATI